jgi:hypothetical protein
MTIRQVAAHAVVLAFAIPCGAFIGLVAFLALTGFGLR